MKKLLLILLLAVSAFANPKLKYIFYLEVGKRNCDVTRWSENVYEDGIFYRTFARVSCNRIKELPLKIGSLQFLDISTDLLFGTVNYYYGER